VVEQYFAASYTQHNPVIPDGPLAIAKLIPTLTALSYEPGMAVADGDLVMVHGRYTGWGPKPMVAVDIFRVKGGKVVEHWDVMQEEVRRLTRRAATPCSQYLSELRKRASELHRANARSTSRCVSS
jgi:predicted SnoaL-like aldol condensation-catalyzing enzyme